MNDLDPRVELNKLIDEANQIGLSYARFRDSENEFEQFQSVLKGIIGLAEKLEPTSPIQGITLDFVKSRRPNDYRLNLIEQLFYFKKYQYRFPRALTGNSDLQMKRRYVMDIIERLQLLRQKVLDR